MNITLFQGITTEAALQKLEEEGKKYEGLYVDMDDKEQRKYVKDNALLINDLLKKLDRARIDKARDHKISIEEEAKRIRERLEAANKPYTLLIDAHKEKRAAILAEEKAKTDAKELLIQIESDHETALMLDKIRDIEVAEREQQRIDNERKIADQASEKARIQAEQAAQDSIDKAEREKQHALLREEFARKKADQALKDAEKLHAKQLRDAELESERKAAEREQNRINEEERLKAAADKKAANKAHQKRVNQGVLKSLSELGVSDDLAKKIITAAIKGEIPRMTINY